MKALWISGKAVIIDSVLCFLKGLLEMRKSRGYVSESIKKRFYLPIGVRVDNINYYFSIKNIGDMIYIIGGWDDT